MPVKSVDVPPLGHVKLYKRRGNRSIRLSLSGDGSVRVSLPYYLPYQAAIQFALSKSKWLLDQRADNEPLLKSGDRIGKAHHLVLSPSEAVQKISSRVSDGRVTIMYPAAVAVSDSTVQEATRRASLKALRAQAEALLPGRLQTLSNQTGLKFQSLRCRQLKSRWGSCSQRKDITLSVYLMQLPWELIDYVLVHELTHTKVLHHGPDFWAELERHVPNAKTLRHAIRAHRPNINV